MLEVFVVCTAILVGLVCGWWLRGSDPRYLRIRTQTADAARTREVLERLRDLTHNVASDVDKHKALMGRISEELHASDDQEPTAVLRALTLSLKAVMRGIDHAARFEGEALSLLLPGATLRGAIGVAERLRAAASRCELPKRFELRHFTVSIGVAEAQVDEAEDQLIERVRDSLTVAHMHGQDCTYVHDGLDFHLIGVGSVSTAS